jgi:hypothetical protein
MTEHAHHTHTTLAVELKIVWQLGWTVMWHVQVREHMMSLLGQTAMLPPMTTLKMSKLQMVQLYGASVMFGYFLRRVEKRFHLARSMGMLPEDQDDAVSRLERLFSLVSCSFLLTFCIPFGCTKCVESRGWLITSCCCCSRDGQVH